MTDYDVIFAGGGLASTLSASRLKANRPELRLLVIEAGERLGGNHTWSCHATDLTAQQNGWMAPFIAHRWPGQMVRFPQFTRRLRAAYQSVTANKLHEAALAQLGNPTLPEGTCALSWFTCPLRTSSSNAAAPSLKRMTLSEP